MPVHQVRRRRARATARGIALAVLALVAVVVIVTWRLIGSTTSAADAPLAPPCQVATGIATAHGATRSYVIMVDVGPAQTVYQPDQLASQHPVSGEVMLAPLPAWTVGAAAGASVLGASASSSSNYLEAHVCSKLTGAPVVGASPTVILVDNSNNHAAQDLPLADMEGVGRGVADHHYGNNVTLTPGASYTVLLSLNGEAANLTLLAPASTNGGVPDSTGAAPAVTAAPGPTSTSVLSGVGGATSGSVVGTTTTVVRPGGAVGGTPTTKVSTPPANGSSATTILRRSRSDLGPPTSR